MNHYVLLCPGQGAQCVGMGRSWAESHPASARVFEAADNLVDLAEIGGGRRLSQICAEGPSADLDRTDVSQPALFTCGIACYEGLLEQHGSLPLRAAAGLSLGEYTALTLAGVLSFEDGLRLVATRGRLMQRAAEASEGGMVALIGADEAQAEAICQAASKGEVLVAANFNAPGQIVLSGHASACERAVEVSGGMGVRSTRLKVAGAFHSPLMAPAAEGMARALERVELRPLNCDVWSNVTARPHERNNPALLKKLLVDQIVSPVRWSQSCQDLAAAVASTGGASFHELAPGTVLKGLFRRIDRSCEVTSHDQAERTERATA